MTHSNNSTAIKCLPFAVTALHVNHANMLNDTNIQICNALTSIAFTYIETFDWNLKVFGNSAIRICFQTSKANQKRISICVVEYKKIKKKTIKISTQKIFKSKQTMESIQTKHNIGQIFFVQVLPAITIQRHWHERKEIYKMTRNARFSMELRLHKLYRNCKHSKKRYRTWLILYVLPSEEYTFLRQRERVRAEHWAHRKHFIFYWKVSFSLVYPVIEWWKKMMLDQVNVRLNCEQNPSFFLFL